jgi:hypothetical protein
MKFCCDFIKRDFIVLDEIKLKSYSIVYDAYWRSYFIPYVSIDTEEECLREISHCPFCGSKLPSDLSDKWYEVLEEDYGITDPQGEERNKVPAEFHTDEWWKKRGL